MQGVEIDGGDFLFQFHSPVVVVFYSTIYYIAMHPCFTYTYTGSLTTFYNSKVLIMHC